MKRRSDWDRDERKIHKVEKGKNKFTKHKKNLYNKLVDQDYYENYDSFDDLYDDYDRRK